MASAALRCLIADPDGEYPVALKEALANHHFEVSVVHSAEDCRTALKPAAPHLMFIDLRILEQDFSVLHQPQLEDCETLIMGNEDCPKTVHRAIRAGASYFFTKHDSDAFVSDLIADVIAERAPVSENVPPPPAPPGQFGLLRGSSPLMFRLYRTLRKVSTGEVSVLLIGESGTGKELAAQTIHQRSTRCEHAFVGINCGAVAPSLIESQLFGHEKGSFSGATSAHKGFFETAHGGTLFLDEITKMPIELQVKLLRALELGTIRRLGSERDIEVDVRIIAATNRQPGEAIADGKLREDLYYRIAQVPVWLPPLRDRAGDKTALAQYFLTKLNEQDGRDIAFTEEALNKIDQMTWAGNVRELRSAVQRAYLLANGTISADLITEEVLTDISKGDYLRISVGDSLEDSERKLIFATLKANDGNKKATAAALGISLKTLYNRLNEYGSHKA